MKKMGITTTVPIEVLLAAGYQPIDLNNVLVANPDPGRLITSLMIVDGEGRPTGIIHMHDCLRTGIA